MLLAGEVRVQLRTVHKEIPCHYEDEQGAGILQFFSYGEALNAVDEGQRRSSFQNIQLSRKIK